MDALELKLIESIFRFSKGKGYPMKQRTATVAQAVGELLGSARNEGKGKGKSQAVDILYNELKKADEFCKNGEYDRISSSLEAFMRKEADSFN